MKYTLEHLNELYDLELDKVVEKIGKEKAKLVLLQFPDGLKQYATSVVDYLEENTNAEFVIWLDSCYGACDTPVLGTAQCIPQGHKTPNCGVKGQKALEKEIDLTIQFGHNELMPSF